MNHENCVTIITVEQIVPELILAKDLRMGQYGIIDDPKNFADKNGDLVFRCYEVIVDMNDPLSTWSNDLTAEVRPILAGTRITIETI